MIEENLPHWTKMLRFVFFTIDILKRKKENPPAPVTLYRISLASVIQSILHSFSDFENWNRSQQCVDQQRSLFYSLLTVDKHCANLSSVQHAATGSTRDHNSVFAGYTIVGKLANQRFFSSFSWQRRQIWTWSRREEKKTPPKRRFKRWSSFPFSPYWREYDDGRVKSPHQSDFAQ